MLPTAGNIKDMTIPWLFQDLRKEKMTGTVFFSRDQEEKKVYLKNGDILFASSNLKEDRLGELLLRKGTITGSQFDSSSEVVIKTGKKLGAVLFEAGILTAQDLVAQVKLQVKEIILTLFSWRDGRYLFDSGPLSASEIIPLHMSTGDLIIDGVRGLEWKNVRRSLPSLKTILRPSTDPSLLFQSVSLDQDQHAVFALINGCNTINEICMASGIGDFNTLKTIYLLLALRIVEVGGLTTEEDKIVCQVVREAVLPRENKPEGPPGTEVVVTREMIQHSFERLERQNHYEVLDVGRNATSQEIKKAYYRYAKRYHPDRHFEPEMGDMKERLEALFSRIHDAYETLSSKTDRDRYDSDIAGGIRKHQAAEHTHPEKTNNQATADAQFNEGMKRFNQGDFWGAEGAFEWAMRLDPGNAEYVFRRALTLARIPRRGHQAEEYFIEAIGMDPSKTDYSLELGNFYARSGLKTKALSVFQNALLRNPDSELIKAAIKKAGE